MDIFEQFIDTKIIEIPLGGFIFNLILAAILSSFLSLFYTRYGHSLSNRKLFARNFVLLSVITMLVITIIKSSLALSLGLVGALSIVRFRAAIKDPEELVYLFLTIAVGLGLGADQALITTTALLMILAILRFRDFWTAKKGEEPNLYLNVSLARSEDADIQDIVAALKKHCSEINMKRFDETAENLEASFLVKYEDFEKLHQSKAELRRLSPSIEISFVDNKTSY